MIKRFSTWQIVGIIAVCLIAAVIIGLASRQFGLKKESEAFQQKDLFPGRTLYIDNVGMATKSPKDLDTWLQALGTRAIGSPDIVQQYSNDGDQITRERLKQDGRIVQIGPMTQIQVKEVKGQIATIQIKSGIDSGKVGYVPKWNVFELSGPNEVHLLSDALPPAFR